MPRIPLTLIAFFLWFYTNGQTVYTVETIPNPKLNNNGYVSNPDSILSAKIVDSLNTILGTIEDSTTVQVAIAVVKIQRNKVRFFIGFFCSADFSPMLLS